MLTHEEIYIAVSKIAAIHPIKKVSYFGSYADGIPTDKSDLDLLIEFDRPRVSLFLLSEIKLDLEDELKVPVDVIHAPIKEGALIEPQKVVSVYG